MARVRRRRRDPHVGVRPAYPPVDGVAREPPDVPIIGWVTAYVDESLRLTGEGLYVLAAVVMPDERAPEVRAALRAAVPRGLRRYHWRKESTASRTAMAELVATSGATAIAVHTHVDPRRQERARRRCLARLLWELAQRGDTTLVFETRQRADASDRRLIKDAERAGFARGTRYAFERPEDEPLLWLADAVAGAVTRALGDGDHTYVNVLEDIVALVPLR